MKTTLELSFTEICLICEMAAAYSRKIDDRLADYEFNNIYEKMGIDTKKSLEYWDRKQKETMALWEKMEKQKHEYIGKGEK